MTTQLNRQTFEISGWPTDVASIDYYDNHDYKDNFDGNKNPIKDSHVCAGNSEKKIGNEKEYKNIHYPHTVIMFIPGIPGCIEWYIDMIHTIVKKLGVGFAVRAVSYAGHGLGGDKIGPSDLGCEGKRAEGNPNSKANIAFTVDGQVEHKIEWTDLVVTEMIKWKRKLELSNNDTMGLHSHSQSHLKLPKFIFLTHSTGAHFVQRMLLLRRDFLFQTQLVVHLTPFHRYDPSSLRHKLILGTMAKTQKQCIALFKFVSYITSLLPTKMVDSYIQHVVDIPQEKDRDYIRKLYSQPLYARNFLSLGLEEARDMPEVHDVAALRIIGNNCPTSILYCAQDQWAPKFHMHNITQAQKDRRLPENISVEYNSKVLHRFVMLPDMIPLVIDFVIRSVTSVSGGMATTKLHSKL
jgi:pimeloyl-ACP methyl ester carboxylesterase